MSIVLKEKVGELTSFKADAEAQVVELQRRLERKTLEAEELSKMQISLLSQVRGYRGIVCTVVCKIVW